MLWISFLKATEQLLLYLFQALCVGEATPPELGEAASAFARSNPHRVFELDSPIDGPEKRKKFR
jgi:hypothetical protein